MTQADLIVIGAGPGGYEVAASEAAAGRSVILIERDLPGGTCLNRGCIPTKCLCACAETALTVASAAEMGIDVTSFTLHYDRAAARMRAIVDGLRDDVRALTSACRYVQGEASFTPEGHVQVDDDIFTAPRIIIATGSRPASLPVPGADLAMTSDEFLALNRLPASLVVIGGGVIGLEMASIAAAFGTEVTVVEYCKEVLPPFDRDIAKRLRTLLSRRGIKFVTGAAVTAVSVDENGDKTVTYAGKKGDVTITASEVLMAVGRRPVVPAGLPEAGIDVDGRGFIVTDDTMQTTRAGVYAVGDCNGRLLLAHAASAQAEVATGHDVDLSAVPSAVFTVPEAAMVGLTAEECERRGMPFAEAKSLFAANGKARANGHTDGLVKVIYDPASLRILGCHIVGPHASDLITEAVTAVSLSLTGLQAGTRLVHGHPTLSEVVSSAFRKIH